VQVVKAELKCVGETGDGQKRGRRDPPVLQATDRVDSDRGFACQVRRRALCLLTAVGDQAPEPPAMFSILIRGLLAHHDDSNTCITIVLTCTAGAEQQPDDRRSRTGTLGACGSRCSLTSSKLITERRIAAGLTVRQLADQLGIQAAALRRLEDSRAPDSECT
jgi:hypothetical protein